MKIGAGVLRPNRQHQTPCVGRGSFAEPYSLLPVLLKVPLRLVPSIPMMLMAATAISAAKTLS
jgi:hypothetical protein